MPDLLSLRAFVAAAAHGGFSAGGRALGLSRDRVSKLVFGLEQRLGRPLFSRSTRTFTLTPAGAAYLERVRRALDELDLGARSVREADMRPFGRLSVYAPLTWGVTVLAPLCAEFRHAFPAVHVDLLLDDARVDPAPERSEVAIRIAEQLRGQVLGRVALGLYAAPTYLAEHGAPEDPDALRNHACVRYAHLRSDPDWVLQRGDERRRLTVNGELVCNVGLAVLGAIQAGAGIGLLPDFLANPAVKEGRLVPVLPDWSAPDLTITAIAAPALSDAPKVLAYINFLITRLSSAAGGNGPG